ncbi:flavodoxin family protein [Candidatus Peribacteria bacterium]|nr:MAG: flavodoxin family protein [Candidatus Peribacteria bacterium]
MSSLHIIYASTSGHTEYVVDRLIASLTGVTAEKQRAELAQPGDLLRGDVLVLATSTWNTGGPEGQLNPHMFALLMDRAAQIDLAGKRVAVIGLGDDRYHFTCAAADHMEEFVTSHGGTLVKPTLRIINEPYGQEKTVEKWAATLQKA